MTAKNITLFAIPVLVLTFSLGYYASTRTNNIENFLQNKERCSKDGLSWLEKAFGLEASVRGTHFSAKLQTCLISYQYSRPDGGFSYEIYDIYANNALLTQNSDEDKFVIKETLLMNE